MTLASTSTVYPQKKIFEKINGFHSINDRGCTNSNIIQYKKKRKKKKLLQFKKKEPEKLGKVVKLTLSKARLSCLSKSTRL